MRRAFLAVVALAGTLLLPGCPHYTASGAACDEEVQCPTGFVCGSNGQCGTACNSGEQLCGDLCTTASSCGSTGTPATVPSAPNNIFATAGLDAATVRWDPPLSSGGSPVLSYTVTAVPGDTTTTISGATSVTVHNLTPGLAYTFTVYATNKIGDGPPSAPSAPITLNNAPASPTDVTATASIGEATVTWSAPNDNGGSPLTGYIVTSHPGDIMASTTGATMVLVTGLTNGQAYTFTVVATNAVGDSDPSSPSSAITLPDVPDAPTNVTAIADVGQAAVSWTAPADNGRTITGYTVTASPGGTSSFVSNGTTAVITGLSNGATCTFTVYATNAVGDGPPSEASSPVTLPAVPNAPTNVTATAGIGQATVSWAAPSTNGSAITGYTVTNVQTGAMVSSSTTSATMTGLTNGSSCTFTVTATNTVGTSVPSEPSTSITLPNVPGAPTNVVATAGNQEAVLTWSAPSDNGSPITGYTVTIVQTGRTVPSSTTGVTVSGLTNGTGYTFTVTAANGVGTGAASSASTSIVPVAVPGAPTNVTAVAGNAQATVSWTVPSANGNAITGYTVTVVQTGATVTSTTNSATITSLANGDTYTFTVTATNGIGTGPASAPSTAITLPSAPNAPGGVTATAGNGQATVSWFAASNSGSPITGYTVTVVQTSATFPTTNTSATITGLTNGDSYTFTVTATNAIGTSPPSTPYNLTLPTAPGAPTNVVATPGNQQVTLTWNPPSSTGGATITSYSSLGTPSGSATTTGATSVIVTGLTNGQSYTFVVFAGNLDGYGPPSDSSAAVTPATIPNAPSNVSATPGNQQATVTWSAPADTGGDPITGYTVTVVQTGATFPASTTSTTVTGLTNGSSYTFTVTATTAGGVGPASSPSTAIVPATVPDAPTNVTATAGDAEATVSWTAPFNEGRTISGYTVTVVQTGATFTSNTTSVAVTGLSNGQSYTFTVTATNAIGTGAASAPSTSITLPDIPGAPMNVSATEGNGIITVTWTAPSSNGGSAIVGYAVTGSPAGSASTAGATSATITGLTYGQSYTFTVTATNIVGTGPASSSSNSVTFAAVPGAPTGVSATPGSQQATVIWTVPAANGSAITGYTVTVVQTGATFPSSTTSAMVTGLTNGNNYTFTVTATNGIGTGSASQPSSPIMPGVGPSGLTYSQNPAVYMLNQTIVNNTPSSNGNPVTSYSISGTPPMGLSFNTSTGILSGTPTTATPATGYIVTATNASGSTQATLTITVSSNIVIGTNNVIAVGGPHSCATVSGGIQCWGDNDEGQLGNNSTTDSSVPVSVSGISSGAQQVAVGDDHTCALVNGGAWCWGWNADGQLGNSSTTSSSIPVQVSGLSSGVQAISAGTVFTCALVNGGVWCWGDNSAGELGNNSTTQSTIPVQVSGLSSDVQAISAGGYHACALTNGSIQCWGDNRDGDLGNNSRTQSNVPVSTGLTGAQAVTSSGQSSCALINGGVECWGDNSVGELGTSTSPNTSSPVPIPIPSLTGVQYRFFAI